MYSGAVRARAWCVKHLTDILQRYGYESSAEVIIEEALEDVQRDVGQAGVGVGVHSQHNHVRSHHPAC